MSEIATDVALDVAFFRRWMSEFAMSIESGCEELTRLDAAIGDADHGINMLRGVRAAMAAIEGEGRLDSPARVLNEVGSSLVKVVGGAAGPLYGSAFRSMSKALDDGGRVGFSHLVRALTVGLESIQRMGAAEPGDKTIVDAWLPAVDVLDAPARGSIVPALVRAERAAERGMTATIPMRARKGRASYLGWRSEGHQDPGATSARMIFASLAAAADRNRSR